MNTTSNERIEFDTQTIQRQVMFTRVILPHEKDLTRYARRLCSGNEDRMQDLVQDALLCAYLACLKGRFREDTHPRAWLQCIATNLYINDYNHRQRWEARTDLDSPPVHQAMVEASLRAALTQTPAALVMAATLDEALEQALEKLPSRSRACMVLVDVEGLEYEAAAQRLGIPLGTLRSRLSRARAKMQNLLSEFGKTHGCRVSATETPRNLLGSSDLLTTAACDPIRH